jgi:hypothetical protein
MSQPTVEALHRRTYRRVYAAVAGVCRPRAVSASVGSRALGVLIARERCDEALHRRERVAQLAGADLLADAAAQGCWAREIRRIAQYPASVGASSFARRCDGFGRYSASPRWTSKSATRWTD